MLHKAPLHLPVLVPAKMKTTQQLRAEYVFIQRQEMSSECMTRLLQMQVRNVLVNIPLLSLIKIWHKSLTISPCSKEANPAFVLVALATTLKTQDPFSTFRNASPKFTGFWWFKKYKSNQTSLGKYYAKNQKCRNRFTSEYEGFLWKIKC